MAAPEQADENQDDPNDMADPAAAKGAAALRLLPAHINELQLAYWATTSEWNLACARLKRFIKRAEDWGAGPSGLPDLRALAELGQNLGRGKP